MSEQQEKPGSDRQDVEEQRAPDASTEPEADVELTEEELDRVAGGRVVDPIFDTASG